MAAEETRAYGYVDEGDYRALKARQEREVRFFARGEKDAREGREPDPCEGAEGYEAGMYRLGYHGPSPDGREDGPDDDEFPY